MGLALSAADGAGKTDSVERWTNKLLVLDIFMEFVDRRFKKGKIHISARRASVSSSSFYRFCFSKFYSRVAFFFIIF